MCWPKFNKERDYQSYIKREKWKATRRSSRFESSKGQAHIIEVMVEKDQIADVHGPFAA